MCLQPLLLRADRFIFYIAIFFVLKLEVLIKSSRFNEGYAFPL